MSLAKKSTPGLFFRSRCPLAAIHFSTNKAFAIFFDRTKKQTAAGLLPRAARAISLQQEGDKRREMNRHIRKNLPGEFCQILWNLSDSMEFVRFYRNIEDSAIFPSFSGL
jgi:hypothetical protein